MNNPPLILAADDEPDICGLVTHHRSRSAYRPRIAADGIQALDALHEEAPDLVLLDLMLPERTGWDIVRELRRLPKHTALPW